MSDFVNNPPEPLTSIPGRARIVDGKGNPVDPDNPPEDWNMSPEQPALPSPSNRMHGASDDSVAPPPHEEEGVGEAPHHARTVHQRRSRTSK